MQDRRKQLDTSILEHTGLRMWPADDHVQASLSLTSRRRRVSQAWLLDSDGERSGSAFRGQRRTACWRAFSPAAPSLSSLAMSRCPACWASYCSTWMRIQATDGRGENRFRRSGHQPRRGRSAQLRRRWSGFVHRPRGRRRCVHVASHPDGRARVRPRPGRSAAPRSVRL